jgi:hypothetical protein
MPELWTKETTMSLPATGLALIDPLTLLGREVLELLPRFPALRGRMVYAHTDPDEEVQVAELEGEPGMVRPLVDPEQLSGCGAVIVASDRDSDSLRHLCDWLEGFPERPAVDLSRLERLRTMFRPVAGPAERDEAAGLHLRIAPPAVVGTRLVLEAVQDLGPIALGLVAVDPASDLGNEGIECLARQAVQRLQGQDITDLVAGHVVAFNHVVRDTADLLEDAVAVLGMPSVSASSSVSGCFHGHVVHLTVTFDEPVDGPELDDVLRSAPGLVLGDLPQGLDGVVGSDRVVVAPGIVSSDGRIAVLTLMLDGHLVGGALTALEALESQL